MIGESMHSNHCLCGYFLKATETLEGVQLHCSYEPLQLFSNFRLRLQIHQGCDRFLETTKIVLLYVVQQCFIPNLYTNKKQYGPPPF